MNYGEPDGGGDRRQRLIQALLGGGSWGGYRGGHGTVPLFGGFGRGGAAGGGFDLPAAALPALSFNPFLAQSQAGVPNLAPPSSVTAPDAGAAGAGGQPGYAGVDPGSTYDPNQTYQTPPPGAASRNLFPVTGQPNPALLGNLGNLGFDPSRVFGGGTPYRPQPRIS